MSRRSLISAPFAFQSVSATHSGQHPISWFVSQYSQNSGSALPRFGFFGRSLRGVTRCIGAARFTASARNSGLPTVYHDDEQERASSPVAPFAPTVRFKQSEQYQLPRHR